VKTLVLCWALLKTRLFLVLFLFGVLLRHSDRPLPRRGRTPCVRRAVTKLDMVRVSRNSVLEPLLKSDVPSAVPKLTNEVTLRGVWSLNATVSGWDYVVAVLPVPLPSEDHGRESGMQCAHGADSMDCFSTHRPIAGSTAFAPLGNTGPGPSDRADNCRSL
jgi:hypothetical protein